LASGNEHVKPAFARPARSLFLKNNQPGDYADQADERYLSRQQYQLPPDEPPELHDKDIFAEESLKRNLK
jgi:hypothetical protein